MKLRCTVGVEARTNRGRADQLQAVESALYLLDEPGFRDGTALADGDDPGFLIESMRLVGGASDFSPTAGAVAVSVVAEGWFWPVGVPEQTGEAIREALVRTGFLPILLDPTRPVLRAGGDPVELRIRMGSVGTMRLRGNDVAPETLPFGSLAVVVRDAGGRPGAGTLTGGTAGTDDIRLVTLDDGAATVTYTPPAARRERHPRRRHGRRRRRAGGRAGAVPARGAGVVMASFDAVGQAFAGPASSELGMLGEFFAVGAFARRWRVAGRDGGRLRLAVRPRDPRADPG